MIVSDNLALLAYNLILCFPLIIFCILLAHLTKNILLFINNLVTGYKVGTIDNGSAEYKIRKRDITIISYVLAGFVLIGLYGLFMNILEALQNID